MTTTLLFDIDSTLTPPRQPITKEMTDILQRLTVPFHVAAGSHMNILEEQFFKPLYDFGFYGELEAFISNGAIHYHCTYKKGARETAPFTPAECIQEISSFNIREYLGEQDYYFILATLEKTLKMPEFQLPDHLAVLGETVAFRGSMINFTTIGRKKGREGGKVQLNRKQFVEFDRANGYRLEVIAHLKREWASLIEKHDLAIMLGGQTSFDIGIAGQDKSNAVRTLMKSGVDKIIFIGDALFEGGNDAVVREYVEKTWPSGSAPVGLIQVESDEQTRAELKKLGFVGE